MDDYWFTGGKASGKSGQILDDQMDSYWDAAAKEKEAAAAAPPPEAPPAAPAVAAE